MAADDRGLTDGLWPHFLEMGHEAAGTNTKSELEYQRIRPGSTKHTRAVELTGISHSSSEAGLMHVGAGQ